MGPKNIKAFHHSSHFTEDVLGNENRYAEDVLKTSSRGLEAEQIFAGFIFSLYIT